MSDINISFKNYKLLKEGEVNLSNGTIFFVQGPNNVGKTSFLNLLRSIMEVKDDTQNPVSFGEKEGFAVGSIVGADGKNYQFRYDFNVDGKKKFMFVDEDSRVIKTVGEMRAIFNYTHFTVEEFFDWSKSVPGRKKQREIFMQLMSPEEIKEIDKIDLLTNPVNGEYVESRKNINKEADFLKKRIDATIISPEQLELYEKRESISELYKSLLKDKEILSNTLSSSDVFKAQIEALLKSEEELKVTYQEAVENFNNRNNEIDEQIRKLTEEKASLKEKMAKKAEDYDIRMETFASEKEELNKKVDVEALLKMEEDLKIINTRIEKGDKTKEELVKIINIIETKKKDEEEYKKKEAEAKSFDEKIETLRKRKKDIVFNSPNIPAGWSLDDDSITIDNIPFVETDISKSKATKAIANLMMRINKAPIMLMGDAESLGYEVLNELDKQAKEHGKVMIFAEHLRDASERKLVCYDDIEHESKNEQPKSLF